jgi:hypothetical protein
MVLPPDQTERFYKIWWALLSYTNAQRHLVPDMPAQPAPKSIEPAKAHKIREALWADDSIRERFIAENSSQLPPADLEIVASWQYRVAGNFFVFRHLKKYTVFLHEGPPSRAYGVLGLTSPLNQIIGPYVPVLVQAVLIPFEDQITYDSLLAPYRITFGGGIKRNLNETYREAQEREGIITTLLPPAQSPTADEMKESHQVRNAKLLREFQKSLYKSGLSPKRVEQHVSNIETFADSLLEQDLPHPLIEITAADVDGYLGSRIGTEANDVNVSLKRFVRFLYDSGRMNADTTRSFQDWGPVRRGRR